jgi:hypothetical protein
MDVDSAAAAAAAVDAAHLQGHQHPLTSAAALNVAAAAPVEVLQDASLDSEAPGALALPSTAAPIPPPAAAAEGSAGASRPGSSSSMPVQNIGLVMQLHRRWMLYQLQQMGRAAMSPLSTAKRAVSLLLLLLGCWLPVLCST